MAAVAISWYKPTATVALNAEVRTKRYHTLECFGHPTAYREIATGLTALAMTEGVVTRLRRFEQSDKLKFEIYRGRNLKFLETFPMSPLRLPAFCGNI